MKLLITCLFVLFSCNPQKQGSSSGSATTSNSGTSSASSLDVESVRKILLENPDIIVDVLDAHPVKILDGFQAAAKKAQKVQQERQKAESFDKPINIALRPDELIRGTKGAPLTLIEFSDFQCGYCSKGFQTVLTLLEKYKGKISFIYKHLPVIGQHSRACAEYYEAIRLQDPDKAMKFHDELYANQGKIRSGGLKYIKEVTAAVGADAAKAEADIKAGKVKARIDEDMAQGRKHGFSGTPGFLLNGVAVKGAYPVDHFVGIVEELKKRGKVKL